MCFQTAQIQNTHQLERRYRKELSDNSLRSYFDKPQYHLNGFTHPNMLVIPQQKPNVLAPGVWGIVPKHKSKEEMTPYFKESLKYGSGLNARSEKVFTHFIYKDAIMENRCIIPVSGFYEPHDYHGKKYPYYFKQKSNSSLALAGLYTVIGSYITFAILTRAASPFFAKIHNKKKRQPLILNEVHTQEWLNNNSSEKDINDILNYTFPENQLETYPVSKNLYNPKVDSNTPDIINKVFYPELDVKNNTNHLLF
ncbi:SOS response-associated peptidase [Tamlana agarivorans]|uniref:SOS response-associated peptidase n=1 Tax=Pseudotamlana agarivorans TaxID=481183 RepID=A0ACC5UA98_9FLAO|nr:SOS response-associated peptidase family protein [Tamlana agarivorans]MBU2951246.1 SOS response-associated peptidase [Tamlana agarivorans]